MLKEIKENVAEICNGSESVNEMALLACFIDKGIDSLLVNPAIKKSIIETLGEDIESCDFEECYSHYSQKINEMYAQDNLIDTCNSIIIRVGENHWRSYGYSVMEGVFNNHTSGNVCEICDIYTNDKEVEFNNCTVPKKMTTKKVHKTYNSDGIELHRGIAKLFWKDDKEALLDSNPGSMYIAYNRNWDNPSLLKCSTYLIASQNLQINDPYETLLHVQMPIVGDPADLNVLSYAEEVVEDFMTRRIKLGSVRLYPNWEDLKFEVSREAKKVNEELEKYCAENTELCNIEDSRCHSELKQLCGKKAAGKF